MDLLAESYSNISPYAYTVNNPIKFIDPDGMRVSVFEMMANQVGSTDEERQRSTGEWRSEGQKSGNVETLSGGDAQSFWSGVQGGVKKKTQNEKGNQDQKSNSTDPFIIGPIVNLKDGKNVRGFGETEGLKNELDKEFKRVKPNSDIVIQIGLLREKVTPANEQEFRDQLDKAKRFMTVSHGYYNLDADEYLKNLNTLDNLRLEGFSPGVQIPFYDWRNIHIAKNSLEDALKSRGITKKYLESGKISVRFYTDCVESYFYITPNP